MTDDNIKRPKQKPQRLTIAFLYANMGEAILEQLGKERSYATVFPAETAEKISAYHKGRLKKEDFAEPGDFIEQVVKPVMDNFLNIACPKAMNKPPIAQWVCKQYLSHRDNSRSFFRGRNSHPMKASDLHKIGENITYFDNLKNSQAFKETGAKTDLLQYKAYAAFEEMLAPHLQRKAQQKASAKTFTLSPEQKARVMAETTVLYDGPEGQVVVAHTPAATRYWANNTKWCISGDMWRMTETHLFGLKNVKMRLPHFNVKNPAVLNFPIYNKRSPVIVLIPKGQQNNKFGMIEKMYSDSTDKKFSTLPQPHQELLESCLASLSDGARKALEAWIPKAPVAGGNDNNPASAHDRALQESVRQEFDNIKRLLKKPDASLWNNRDFVRAAVKQDNRALKYAARKLRRDHGFITSLLEECADLPFNISRRTKNEVVGDFMEQYLDLTFNIPSMKGKVASLRGKARLATGKKVWRPDDAALLDYQTKALERMAEEGDMEKFVNCSRRYKATWGDAETLFAGNPAATFKKVKAEIKPL